MASARKISTFIFLKTSTLYIFYALSVCNLLSGVHCEIASPTELTRIVGQDVIFHFNTTGKNSITAAKFGLDNGSEEGPSPKFITAMIQGKENPRIVYGDELNGPAAASYKNRVFFVGNLTEGHAWFRIANLTLGDTNVYVGKIREDSDEKYGRPKRIKLTVLEKGHAEITSPKNVSEKKYKYFEGVANKTCKSKYILGDTLAVYDVLKRAYRNMAVKHMIKTKLFRNKNRVWFYIELAEAVNRSYAYSFLETAQRNNQLNCLKITCFEKVDKKHKPGNGINPSKSNILLVIFFVLIGVIVLVLFIVGVLSKRFCPELVQPFFRLFRDLERRIREWVFNPRAANGRGQ